MLDSKTILYIITNIYTVCILSWFQVSIAPIKLLSKLCRIIFYMFLSVSLTIVNVYASSIVENMIGSIFIILASTLLYRPFLQSAFAGLYFYFCHLLIEDIVVMIFSLTGTTTYSTAMNGKLEMVLILIIIEIAFFINMRLAEPKLKILQNNSRFLTYWFILCSLVIFSLIILHVTSINSIAENYTTWTVLIEAFLLYSILHFVLYCLSNILKLDIIRSENELLINTSHFYGTTLSYKIQNQNAVIQQIHDIKNTYVALRILASKGELECLIHKLDEELGALPTHEIYTRCGIREIDDIINYKIEKSGLDKSIFNLNYKIEDCLNIDTIDCTILIGNILDNAIEAVNRLNKDKKIIVFITIDRNIFYIEVRNTYNNVTNTDSQGKFLSTKAEPYTHGYGLKSIEKIAEKYFGICHFTNDSNGEFTSQVLLYQKQTNLKQEV